MRAPVRWQPHLRLVAWPRASRLWRRKVVQRRQERADELIEAGEAEFHLRFDTDDPDDPKVPGVGDAVLQQRRLADSGFTRRTSVALKPRRTDSSRRISASCSRWRPASMSPDSTRDSRGAGCARPAAASVTAYSPGYQRCRSTVSATARARSLLLASLPGLLNGAVTDQFPAESHGNGWR